MKNKVISVLILYTQNISKNVTNDQGTTPGPPTQKQCNTGGVYLTGYGQGCQGLDFLKEKEILRFLERVNGL